MRKSIATTACLKIAAFDGSFGSAGLSRTTFHGPPLTRGNSNSTTTRFGRLRELILRWRQCASCAVRYLTCGWPISAVGSDGRNRTLLSAFQSRTGRNQPSNTRYIFGPSVWLRSLIKPPEGWGVAYLDWSQQEFAIAAVLSGDEAMQAAYMSGDPYLEFAKQAGLVPPDATKKTHGAQRELCKYCVLGVAYGMEAKSLAQRIGKPEIVARDLLRAHRETYPKFWDWSDAIVDRAMLLYPLLTVFGWPIRIGSDPNPRSLRNFPCQANGAEMLRLAACFATEQGIEVCALIHDAVLIAAPLDQLDHDIERMKAAMAKASRLVLDGFELRTDVNVVRYPGRYQDPRGAVMWEQVMKLVTKRETAKLVG